MKLGSASVFSIAAAVVAAIASLIYFGVGFGSIGDFHMSVHGWIALALGTSISVLVGGGLAAVLIISRRNGYDENAHEAVLENKSED
jgi:hypothetical protein